MTQKRMFSPPAALTSTGPPFMLVYDHRLKRGWCGVKAIEKLVDHWAELDLDDPPRVHPADRAPMDRAEGFNTGFMPYPYVGDIRAADVWALMLNSNIGPADAKEEAEP